MNEHPGTTFVFDDVDDIVYAWENIFNTIVDLHCPWREKRVKQAKQPPSMTKEVINQLRNRDVLLKVARRSNDTDNWAKYRSARNKAGFFLRSAKRELFNLDFKENKNNVGAISKTIKTLPGTTEGTTQHVNKLIVDGRDADNTKEVAEQFNTCFCSIADKLKRSLSYVPLLDLSKLNNFVQSCKDSGVRFSLPTIITSEQVINIILKISPNKASDIDKISASLLRIAATNIAPSIARIINYSFSSGKFPQRWKIAKVTPLLKSGANSNPCNYRPISVLPIFRRSLNDICTTLFIFS